MSRFTYTPTTFPQAQEVIGSYEQMVEHRDRTIDKLQRACVSHIADTLPYQVAMFPPCPDQTVLVFTGHTLVWITPPSGDEGGYDRFIYEPLRTLHVDVSTLPRDVWGDPMPVVCWRGVLWVPTLHYHGTMADERERLIPSPVPGDEEK